MERNRADAGAEWVRAVNRIRQIDNVVAFGQQASGDIPSGVAESSGNSGFHLSISQQVTNSLK